MRTVFEGMFGDELFADKLELPATIGKGGSTGGGGATGLASVGGGGGGVGSSNLGGDGNFGIAGISFSLPALLGVTTSFGTTVCGAGLSELSEVKNRLYTKYANTAIIPTNIAILCFGFVATLDNSWTTSGALELELEFTFGSFDIHYLDFFGY
ncbi:MAG: hypothetical protein AB8B66_00420 [Rickettsiaceae bacterium]